MIIHALDDGEIFLECDLLRERVVINNLFGILATSCKVFVIITREPLTPGVCNGRIEEGEDALEPELPF